MAQSLQSPTIVPIAPVQPVKPARFAPYPGPASHGERVDPHISPAELHKVLDVAPFVRVTFATEKRLMGFRQMIYSVNGQGKFRYATRRDGWSSLIVLRLK
jgi:hypothetical protein